MEFGLGSKGQAEGTERMKGQKPEGMRNTRVELRVCVEKLCKTK